MRDDTLREMRKSFGWSQERLAEALGVDVATISRWERGKTKPGMINATRVGRIVSEKIGGMNTRIGMYGTAMVPTKLMNEVKLHAGDRSLLYGRELVTLAVSDYALQRWPTHRIILGHAARPFVPDEMMPLFDGIVANYERFFSDPPVMLRSRSKTPLKTGWSPGIPERAITVTFPLRHIGDVIVHDCLPGQYEKLPDFEIIEL